MNFLSKLKNKLRKKYIAPKTPLVHKDSESKNSMMGSTYSKPRQTCEEWQNEYLHRAEFIDDK